MAAGLTVGTILWTALHLGGRSWLQRFSDHTIVMIVHIPEGCRRGSMNTGAEGWDDPVGGGKPE